MEKIYLAEKQIILPRLENSGSEIKWRQQENRHSKKRPAIAFLEFCPNLEDDATIMVIPFIDAFDKLGRGKEIPYSLFVKQDDYGCTKHSSLCLGQIRTISKTDVGKKHRYGNSSCDDKIQIKIIEELMNILNPTPDLTKKTSQQGAIYMIGKEYFLIISNDEFNGNTSKHNDVFLTLKIALMDKQWVIPEKIEINAKCRSSFNEQEGQSSNILYDIIDKLNSFLKQ